MPKRTGRQDGVLRAQVFDGMVTLDGKDNGIRGRAAPDDPRKLDDYRTVAGDAGARQPSRRHQIAFTLSL